MIVMHLCQDGIPANFGETNFVEISKSVKSMNFTALEKRMPYGNTNTLVTFSIFLTSVFM